MPDILTVTRYDQPTIAYAELWARWPFAVNPWWEWAGEWLPAEAKQDQHGTNAAYKFDIPAPCWVSWEGVGRGGVYHFRLVGAYDEDQLSLPPGHAFEAIYPGLNVIRIEEAEPEPIPDNSSPPIPDTGSPPMPDTGTPHDEWGRQARVLMYLPVGSPPFIVKPSAGESEPVIKIVKTPEDYFERLWEMLPSD